MSAAPPLALRLGRRCHQMARYFVTSACPSCRRRWRHLSAFHPHPAPLPSRERELANAGSLRSSPLAGEDEGEGSSGVRRSATRSAPWAQVPLDGSPLGHFRLSVMSTLMETSLRVCLRQKTATGLAVLSLRSREAAAAISARPSQRQTFCRPRAVSGSGVRHSAHRLPSCRSAQGRAVEMTGDVAVGPLSCRA